VRSSCHGNHVSGLQVARRDGSREVKEKWSIIEEILMNIHTPTALTVASK
jgi:hypothetical protein